MMNTPNSLTYFEDLSNLGITCPHEDAFPPDGNKIYYRYIPKGVVNSDCFLPTPLREDRAMPESFDDCIGKSVSIFDDLDNMLNALFRLPFNKGKKKTIAVLKLCEKDGVLKQTFENPSHHSWWRAKDFVYESVTLQEILIS